MVIKDEISKKVESEEGKEIGDVQSDKEGEASRTEEHDTTRKRAPDRADADKIGTYAEADSDDE